MFNVQQALLQPLTDLFTTDSRRSYRLCFLLLVTFILTMVATLVYLGCPSINAMPWDIVAQIDAAWRVISGQRPNVDFTAIIPPLTIGLTAFGMMIAAPSAATIAYGNILFFLMVTPWAWFIARERLSAVMALCFAALMGLLVVAPRALGDAFRSTSYAMLYNRQGWVLLSMLLVSLFLLRRRDLPRRDRVDGWSTGILLGLLLFSKLTFFLVGGAAVLLRAAVFGFPSISYIVGTLGGFSLSLIVFQGLLHTDLFAYFSEMWFIAPIYSGDRVKDIIRIAVRNSDYLLIAMLPLLMLIWQLDKKRGGIGGIKLGILISYIAVTGILLCAFSIQEADIPLFLVAGVVALEYLRREFQYSGESLNTAIGTGYFCSIIIVIPVLIGNVIAKDAASIGYAILWDRAERHRLAESQKFQSPALADMLIPKESVPSRITPTQPANVYPGLINDGLSLLRKYVSSDSRILALDFSNPFPFALGLKAPLGSPVWWTVDASFSKTHFPDPDRVFGDATMLLIPQHRADEEGGRTVEALCSIYKPYLQQHFVELDRSRSWLLLVRNKDTGNYFGQIAP